MARSAYREAAAGFEQALDALRHLPESRERTEQAIDLHLDASGALVAAGRVGKSAEHDPRGRSASPRRWATSAGWGGPWPARSPVPGCAGDPDRALELGQRALGLATAHDESLQASWRTCLGVVWQAKGDYRRAVERLRRGAEALQDDRRHERTSEAGVVTSVCARDRLAWCLAELGEFAEAMARAEEAGRIAREIDHAPSRSCAYRSLGLVSLRRGDLSRPSRRSSVLSSCAGRSRHRPSSTARLHASATRTRCPGGSPRAWPFWRRPWPTLRATGVANHPLFLAYLGEAHLLAGRRDDARAVARRALDLAHRQKERGNEAWVLRLLGEIAAHADPPDLESAEAHYRQALARADELGMRPLVAHCHLGLGTLYRRPADRAKAAEHLTTATTMYREMGMNFWLEKADAELRGVER